MRVRDLAPSEPTYSTPSAPSRRRSPAEVRSPINERAAPNFAITLAELRALGQFVRYQDIGPRVAELDKS